MSARSHNSETTQDAAGRSLSALSGSVSFVSVCSGIEAASVAWEPMGWKAQAFAEIEKFPSAVLAHHWPDVPNLGDLTKYHDWPTELRPDLVVGGTPCQAFSVAGLRKGLDDPRGNLTLVFLGLLERLRPRWVVWENVPGVLSDQTGAFGAFLGGLGELGYGFAYRVLDAQNFGVPQRRRRVFVVGHLGDWRRAAAVLFEPESLRGDHPPRREAGQSVAALTANGVGTCGADDNQGQAGHLITRGDWPAEIAPTLNAAFGDKQGLEDQHINGGCGLFVPTAYRTSGNCGAWETGDKTDALTTGTDPFNHVLAFSSKDQANGGGQVAVAFAIQDGALRENPSSGPQGKGYQEQLAYTIEAREAMSKQQCVATSAVRRLTPRECERLQGFPDDHTLIPWRGKMAPDGPRYKALGNSMAVPVMRWIGARINELNVESIHPESKP